MRRCLPKGDRIQSHLVERYFAYKAQASHVDFDAFVDDAAAFSEEI
jgi:hypothetical protein